MTEFYFDHTYLKIWNVDIYVNLMILKTIFKKWVSAYSYKDQTQHVSLLGSRMLENVWFNWNVNIIYTFNR